MPWHHAALPFAFAAFGVLWGAWQAALPELAARFGLSSGPLGLILTAGFAGSLPIMLLTGRARDRLGAAVVMAVPAVVMALAMALVALTDGLALVIVAVVLLVASSGAYDVAINAAGMADATWSRPARMTLLHAAFSAGGVTGALAAGLAASVGLTAATYAGLSVLLLATAAVTGAVPWPRPRADRGAVPPGLLGMMIPLAAIASLAFLIEGSMETWSAIYLRDELGAAAFVGALGPASFHAAMLVGRLVGAGVAGWLGARSTLLVAGVMVLAGMAAALLADVPAPAIGGMAVAALGASFVVPVVVSLAAARAGRHAGRGASYVLTLGYGGFLVGPSLVGLTAELVGLRGALLVVPLSGILIALGSRVRDPRGARPGRTASTDP